MCRSIFASCFAVVSPALALTTLRAARLRDEEAGWRAARLGFTPVSATYAQPGAGADLEVGRTSIRGMAVVMAAISAEQTARWGV